MSDSLKSETAFNPPNASEMLSTSRSGAVTGAPPAPYGAALQLRWVFVTRRRARRLRLARGSRFSAPALAGSLLPPPEFPHLAHAEEALRPHDHHDDERERVDDHPVLRELAEEL